MICVSYGNCLLNSGRIGRSMSRELRTSFALEKAAGDLAGGVRALAIVDREGNEVAVWRRRLGRARRDQNHRVPEPHHGGSARQLRPFAGADRQGLLAQPERDFVLLHV
jgi:hypothetical protein